jgi:hypothetical protein
LTQERREAVGTLTDVDEFAAVIVQAGGSDRYSRGESIYVAMKADLMAVSIRYRVPMKVTPMDEDEERKRILQERATA